MLHLLLIVFGALWRPYAIVEKQEPMANYFWSNGYRKRPVHYLWYWSYWFG